MKNKSKKCSKCKKEKLISAFNKNKSKKDGYDIYCKDCNNKKCQKYNIINKIKILEQKKNDYNQNKLKYILKEINKDAITQKIKDIKIGVVEGSNARSAQMSLEVYGLGIKHGY